MLWIDNQFWCPVCKVIHIITKNHIFSEDKTTVSPRIVNGRCELFIINNKLHYINGKVLPMEHINERTSTR